MDCFVVVGGGWVVGGINDDEWMRMALKSP
jgi:hypothetical protein